MNQAPVPTFSVTQHALLFAWLARQVIERVGAQAGEAAMRHMVQRYGEQRGRRMARRAQAYGHALDMLGFMTYGEWAVGPDEMHHRLVQKSPDACLVVSRCPWANTWEAHGLTEYGRLYCLEIDHALVRGFNPSLRLLVNHIRTVDGQPCEFVYCQANLDRWNSLRYWLRKRLRPGRAAVMPWAYHIGHLYKVASEVLPERLGAAGEQAVEAALAEFAARFGGSAARTVAACREVDFEALTKPAP